MLIAAIDPGDVKSAFVIYDDETDHIIDSYHGVNAGIQAKLQMAEADHFAVEMVATYGRPVGRNIFETCVWIGRFIEAWTRTHAKLWSFVYRNTVICHLCGSRWFTDPATGKRKGYSDSHIRSILIERYGGKDKAIGGVKCRKCKGKGWFGAGRPTCPECGGGKWLHPPGPLASFKDHHFAALGVAITFAETR